MKFYSTPLEEQETHIWIDYFEKKLIIYTTRQPVFNRLKKKLGEPTKVDTINGKVISGTWQIILKDRKAIQMALKMGVLVGNFGKE